MMQLIPAIDLRGGKCVRLYQGRYDAETVYADDPVEVLDRYVAQSNSTSKIRSPKSCSRASSVARLGSWSTRSATTRTNYADSTLRAS